MSLRQFLTLNLIKTKISFSYLLCFWHSLNSFDYYQVSGHHYYQSSSSQQRSFFDDSGIGMIQEKESSFNNSSSTEIIGAANDEKGLIVQQPNRRGSIGKSPQHGGGGKHNQQVNYASFNLNNTVLFNNDEHSLMNSKEISSTVLPSNNTSNIDDPEFIRLQNG